MKQKIPIAAISFQDMIDNDPAKFPDLLSDRSLINDLTVELENIASDVVYLLVLEDHVGQTHYPVYAKRYEVVLLSKQLKYRKVAEYDYNKFKVEFNDDGFPEEIVVDSTVN